MAPTHGPRGRIEVATPAGMQALGRRLAGLLHAGDLVVLSGPLGAGKTTLVQGIGQGLGVRGPVTSPTFVIARVHPALGRGPGLVHADAYRLGSVAEVDDLDLDASLDDCVTVVEWGEGLVDGLAAGPAGGRHHDEPGRARPGGRASRDAVGQFDRYWRSLGIRCGIRASCPTAVRRGHIVSACPRIAEVSSCRAAMRICVGMHGLKPFPREARRGSAGAHSPPL